jgi:hypothetical protein
MIETEKITKVKEQSNMHRGRETRKAKASEVES